MLLLILLEMFNTKKRCFCWGRVRYEQGNAGERGLLDEINELVARDVHSIGISAINDVNYGVDATAVPCGE